MNLARLKKTELVWRLTHRCVHRHTYIEHPECAPSTTGRLGHLDIETTSTGFKADAGHILSWCIKPDGDDNIIFDVITAADIKKADMAIGDEDRRVMKSLAKAILEFDTLTVHYGTDWRFDIPFIRTRA